MGAKFIHNCVKAIAQVTNTNSPVKSIKANQPSVESNEVDVAVPSDTKAFDDFDGDGGDDGVNWDALADEVLAENDQTISLGEFECGINNNPAIHSWWENKSSN